MMAKEEEGEEVNEDAEAAYRNVTSLKNTCDDIEFEYEEDVFSKDLNTAKTHNTQTNTSTTSNDGQKNNIVETKTTVDVGTANAVNGLPVVEHDVSSSECAPGELEPVKFSNIETCLDASGNHVTFGIDKKILHREDVNEDTEIAEWKEEHKMVTEEWSCVQVVTPVEGGTSVKPVVSRPAIAFSEALDHYISLDTSEYQEKIRPCIERTGFSALCYSFIGPPALSDTLVRERDFIFTVALVKFDDDSSVCSQILSTVYKGLTKTKIECPRYGKHWETIGFQGNDPSTDLRGCGMLGLLTLLNFITSKTTSVICATIYTLSQDAMQNFPFSVMSINVTRIAMQVLREGKLNKECNKRLKRTNKSAQYQSGENTGIVFEVFQNMFAAIFQRIYCVWKSEYKTMADSGYVMKDVETYALKKTMQLLKDPTQGIIGAIAEVQENDAGKFDGFVGIDEL